MSEKQSPLVLEQCEVYSIQAQKATKIPPAKKWTLLQRADNVLLSDAADYTLQFPREVLKIKYQQSLAFYLKNQNTYVAIVLGAATEQAVVVEYRLQATSVKVVEWEGASKKAQDDLKLACGSKIHESFSFKGSTSLTYKIGGFFGAINTLVAKPTKDINEAATQKLEGLKEEKLSEETKSKWGRFKDKARELNHGAAEAIRPAKEKVGGLVDKIGDKFEQSDNKLIKGIRNFGNSLKDSLNEGYRNSMRGSTSGELKEEANERVPESNRNLS